MRKQLLFNGLVLLLILFFGNGYGQTGAAFKQWADESSAVIERDFRMPNSALYKENLSSSYAYNWPLGIQFAALIYAGNITQAEALANEAHSKYWCNKNGYWAYNAAAELCDSRFFDDNAWMAKAYMELYNATNNNTYLDRAKEILVFVMSGEFPASSDPMRTTGSIKWDEGNTNWCLCSSAPTAVANLQVYHATGDTKYLDDGTRVYNWIRNNRFGLGGGYRGYENAVVTQAAILLYKATDNTAYRDDAVHLGLAMETVYVDWASHKLHETAQWGGHDMTNAYVDLYEMDGDINWLNIAAGYLQYIHTNLKDGSGRYPENWDAPTGTPGEPLLLRQAPVFSAYARMAQTPGGQTKYLDPVGVFRNCGYNAGDWNAGLLIGRYTTADLAFLGVYDNDISSVRVLPGYRVKLYDQDNFTGGYVTFTGDASCLSDAGWNDRVSSLVVEPVTPTIIVYSDCDYAGRAVNLPIGTYTLAQLQARAINDNDISSLRVAPGYQIQVYEDDNFSGASQIISTDSICLQNGSFNNRTTSLRIRAGTTNDVASFFTECNYLGKEVGLLVGDYDKSALIAKGLDDDAISSLRVKPGYEVVVYQLNNFSGDKHILNEDDDCLVDNGINNSISSLRIRVASGAVTGAEVVLNKHSFTVYPNPVGNTLIIQLPDTYRSETFSIQNSLGVKVITGSLKDGSVDVTSLPPGAYSLQFFENGELYTVRFVKK